MRNYTFSIFFFGYFVCVITCHAPLLANSEIKRKNMFLRPYNFFETKIFSAKNISLRKNDFSKIFSATLFCQHLAENIFGRKLILYMNHVT